MRRLVALSLLLIGLPACGESGSDSGDVDLAGARTRVVAERTARFTLSVTGRIAGTAVRATENGTVSLVARRAHLYKLPPGGALPQEVVVVGPLTYTNANVDAALHDPTVKPWTVLDARRLAPAQRRRRPDELAHVRVLAYLSDGVTDPKRAGTGSVGGELTTRFRGYVDPDRVARAAPAADRDAIRAAIRNDYLDEPFPAEFWVDDDGRVRRVHVTYRTARGGRITVDGRLTEFGVGVDVRVPPRRAIEEISPG